MNHSIIKFIHFEFVNYFDLFQECLALSSAIISNITALNEFVNKFNVELPIHNLKPSFNSKVRLIKLKTIPTISSYSFQINYSLLLISINWNYFHKNIHF